MVYKSYKNAALVAMKLCKKEFCIGVGTLVVGEAQSICPVDKSPHAPHPGNLKKSIVSEVMPGDKGVYIGVTESAPYGILVEKGSSKQSAQPYLEPGAMNSIPKLPLIANNVYKQFMGGK